MFKSLRWRLQVWHATILAFVVLGFGAALYYQIRRTALNDIDTELLNGARMIDTTLKSAMLRFRPGSRLPTERFEAILSLPPAMIYRRGPKGSLPYFAVYGPDAVQIAGDDDGSLGPPLTPPREYEFVNVGPRREVVLPGPPGHLILVGRDISPVLDDANRLLWPIGLSSLVVLAIGLLGGWWLANRAIEPLQRISSTASSISAQNLASRIDVKEMDSELEQLGTILNSMLQRLADSFDQQTQFVADASHELRTPISVLSMHCELALARDRQPAEYKQTLTTCKRAAERMKCLVEDLLTLARADAGQLVKRNEQVDLSLIVDESVQLLSPLATQHQVTFEINATPTICSGDSNQLLRMVSNLLSNAILYNRSGGRVSIEVCRTGETAVLKINDTGLGIEPDEVAKIFKRFYRIDEARSREIGGSGLGLSICQSIAAAHGGKLLLASDVGIGTTVEFRL